MYTTDRTTPLGALRSPGDAPDRFALATVVARRDLKASRLLAELERPEVGR